MPKSTNSNSIDGELPPNGISKKDWIRTPIAVRKFIISMLNSNQEQWAGPENYQPKWPVWVMLLANLTVLIGLSLLLANKIVLPCISPHQVSELSVAFILLVVLHLIWRAIRIPDPANIKVNLGCIQFPVTVAITIFNEIHPWRLSSRLLVFLLMVFLIIGSFLNLTPYSPFHQGGEPFAIQGFVVKRQNSPEQERLIPGETLTMTVGETVIVDVAFLGDVQTTCTWDANTQNDKTRCSIPYTALTVGQEDILSVFAKSSCDSGLQSASLFIVVKP